MICSAWRIFLTLVDINALIVAFIIFAPISRRAYIFLLAFVNVHAFEASLIYSTNEAFFAWILCTRINHIAYEPTDRIFTIFVLVTWTRLALVYIVTLEVAFEAFTGKTITAVSLCAFIDINALIAAISIDTLVPVLTRFQSTLIGVCKWVKL